MTDHTARIAENADRVRRAIAEAARRSGRQAADVRLIAVTKFVGVEAVEALIAAGCREFGESRPQELWQKAEHFQRRELSWHLIGHLQRNKARRTLPLIRLLHSGDSLRLLDAVQELASPASPLEVLLEVNVSGDQTKHGFLPGDLEPVLPQIAAWPGLRVRGLMCMAAWGTTPDEARRDFAALRQLRDRLAAVSPPGLGWQELSMGMSGDFEAAIEEGATLVRVGSALFEGIDS